MSKILTSADMFFIKSESLASRIVVAMLLGCVFLLLAALFSAVRLETFYHGNGFTRLSVDPFQLEGENDLRFRILSPLVGHLLYMRGPLFKYFMLFVLAVFFGLLYFFMRRKNLRPVEAIGIMLLFVFSTLSFYQLYFPAYTDPASFLLILLFMFNYKNRIIAFTLLLLMLFNHENNIFLFPFFFLLLMGNDFSFKHILKIFMLFALAFLPYIIYRKVILMNTEVAFTTSYYFNPGTMQWTREHVLPHLAEGIFQAFRLAWLLPIFAIGISIYKKQYRNTLLMIVVLVFVFSQLLIAWDISRLVGMAFPVIILSALQVRAFIGSEKFLLLVYAIILLNFFIPSYCIGALDPIPYKPLWLQ